MEDVLAVYQLPHDPRFPDMCMDESNGQLVGEAHVPIASAPGQRRIVDHEYVRPPGGGVQHFFVEIELLAGRHQRSPNDAPARRAGRSSSKPCWLGDGLQLELHQIETAGGKVVINLLREYLQRLVRPASTASHGK
jgi:hypothetical protein